MGWSSDSKDWVPPIDSVSKCGEVEAVNGF